MFTDTPAHRMRGRFDHTMDDKNRIIVPLKFREKLGDEFVLTQGPSKSIRAYPKPVFEELELAFASKSAHDEYDASSQMIRRMIGSSDVVSLDSQNRITIPRFLKEWAGMTDQDMNTILGAGSHVEFWKKASLTAIEDSYTIEAVSNALATRGADIV